MPLGQPRSTLLRLWPALLVPLFAFLLTLPLFLQGPSCGHDFGFHMQSWMDAGKQIRHGVLLPHWAYTPAFNAGEPRFIFYPPLSWLAGSLLLILLPPGLVPAAFTFLAFVLAGLGMLALARRYSSRAGAVFATALYLCNPYLLFTAFERTAYAELLAAAWLPWLFLAALAEELTVLGTAVPIMLLWLTNAPAAVMGTYAFVFLILVRLVQNTTPTLQARTGSLGLDRGLALRAGAGLVLGLALTSFYLIPAAWERRYVQIAMAIIPNMRIEDNFLFGHTGYGPHDAVLHTASLVAVSLIALTAVSLFAAVFSFRRHGSRAPIATSTRSRLWAVFLLAGSIILLVQHASLPAWHLLPELPYLQFPWRWMSVLGCIFALTTAMALAPLRIPPWIAGVVALCLSVTVAPLALRPFRQGCDAHELPADRVALFGAHHGVGPTDEYTPGEADNDQLRWDDPAWWLASDPNAPGPHTVPNPASTIIDYDAPPPLDQTVSGQAPAHLHLRLPQPQDLILNLRDYPAWVVTVNGQKPAHLQRDDGLIAVPVPAGSSDIDVHWRRLPDVWLGDAVSLAALALSAAVAQRSRKIRSET